jgi:hypothetical protein
MLGPMEPYRRERCHRHSPRPSLERSNRNSDARAPGSVVRNAKPTHPLQGRTSQAQATQEIMPNRSEPEKPMVGQRGRFVPALEGLIGRGSPAQRGRFVPARSHQSPSSPLGRGIHLRDESSSGTWIAFVAPENCHKQAPPSERWRIECGNSEGEAMLKIVLSMPVTWMYLGYVVVSLLAALLTRSDSAPRGQPSWPTEEPSIHQALSRVVPARARLTTRGLDTRHPSSGSEHNRFADCSPDYPSMFSEARKKIDLWGIR